MATSAEIRQQLVAALHSDLIGPGWDDVARRHEQLPQPPSVWYTTGFLVPHVFQQEAGRTSGDEQLSFSDLAGEEPSNDGGNRLEKKEKEDDANDALDQANTRRSWFTSSFGLSFILERGSTIEATVSWGDYTAPVDGDDEKRWLRTPRRHSVTLTIAGEGTSTEIPLEANPQGLCLRWIARVAPKKLGYPSDQLSVSFFLLNKREPPKTNQIRHRDPVSAFCLMASLQDPAREDALQTILSVGTSAGGARAKALITWNPGTGEVRSGQLDVPPGFGHWLLKFDGVSGNKDRELEDPQGYGVIEFAYNKMAEAAGITMSECRLLEENGRRHFITRRFDRDTAGARLHMQSLGAMAHLDYNEPGSSSYEQAFLVMRQLRLPMQATEEQFRRMVFNLAARNQDDHVKNIAFLMDCQGQWSLSPAFDVTWSFNPQGDWTATHQMSVNGKRDQFNRTDLEAIGRTAQLKRGRAETIAEKVITAVRAWPRFAAEAGVPEATWSDIQSSHRLTLLQP